MRSRIAASARSLVVALFASAAFAQGYPSKAVRVIVPFPPGGPTDVVGRVMMEKVAANWNNPVVADWRPGGNTIIGTDAVAKSAPDGYTWLLTVFTHTTMPALYKNLPFDPIGDFAGAAMLASYPMVAVVPASLPAASVSEFVALAKSQPGKFNYLLPAIGSSAQFNTELLKMNAGIDVTAVPYKGLAPGLPDLLSGRLHFGFMTLSLVVPHIKTGKLRALAVASRRRASQLPDVPTMAEAGYPDAQVVGWVAILVPAKTPRDIVSRISREVTRALADPEVMKRVEEGGLIVESPMTPEEIDLTMKREKVRWAKFMKDARIEVPD